MPGIRQVYRKIKQSGALSSVIETSGANLLKASVTLASGVLVARLLGPAGRGELAAIQVWGNIAGMIALFGLSDAIVYFVARMPERDCQWLGTAQAASIFFGLFVGSTLYYLLPHLLSAQRAVVHLWGRQYLSIVLVMIVTETSLAVLRARSEYRLWNAVRLTAPVTWLAVILFCWIADVRAAGDVALIYLAIRAILATVSYLIARWRMNRGAIWDREKLSQLIKYGGQSLASDLPKMINFRADQMIMAAFLPPEQLGLYAVATAWSNGVDPLVQSVGQIGFPEIASIDDQEERDGLVAKYMRSAAVIGMAALLTVSSITPLALPLTFGDEFEKAVPLALILIVGEVAVAVGDVVKQCHFGLGKPGNNVKAEILGVCVGLPAVTVGIYYFGLIGAAVASALTYCIVGGRLVHLLSRETETPAKELLVPKRQDARRLLRIVNIR